MERLNRFRKRVQKVLFRTKDISKALQTEQNERKLPQLLRIPDLLAIGVGSTVGAGIFVLTGQVAKTVAGPGIVLSYLASGIACVFSGLCYSEFASRVPVAGSAYLYAYYTVGEFIAWFIGWDLILEYVLAASAVARGWSGYLASLFSGFGVIIPKYLYRIPYNCPADKPQDHCPSVDFLAFSIVTFITIICALGTKNSSRFNIAMMIITIIAIVFVVITGATVSSASNWENFFPFGASGVFQGAAIIFFAYVGFDTVSTFAEEVSNPKRDMPIGIIGSIAISAALYCAVSLVVTGMVPYDELDPDAPLSLAFAKHGLLWAQVIVSIGAFFALTTSILGAILGMPRIFMAMSRDGLFFPIFKEVHPRFGTPFYGTLLTGFFAGVLTLLIDIEILADMVSIGTLMAFLAVCASVLILRIKNPEAPKKGTMLTLATIGLLALGFAAVINSWHLAFIIIFFALSLLPIGLLFREPHFNIPNAFVCPLVPLIPILGMAANIYLILNLGWLTLLRWFI